MVVYIFDSLEYAVRNVAHLSAHRMAYDTFHAITSEGAVGSHGGGQTCNFIAIGGDIAVDVVMEAVLKALPPAEVELEAVVFHSSGVNPFGSALSENSYAGHIHQNVAGVLPEIIERTVKGIVEEGEVHSEVSLCGGLPLDVIVAYLVTLEAGRQLRAPVGTRDIIRGAVTLTAGFSDTIIGDINGVTGNVGNLLIAGLSPGNPEFQIIQPICSLHKAFLAESPSERCGGEGGKAVVASEAGRTVVANRKGEKIAVGIGVVCLGEERNKRVAVGRAVGHSLA